MAEAGAAPPAESRGRPQTHTGTAAMLARARKVRGRAGQRGSRQEVHGAEVRCGHGSTAASRLRRAGRLGAAPGARSQG